MLGGRLAISATEGQREIRQRVPRNSERTGKEAFWQSASRHRAPDSRPHGQRPLDGCLGWQESGHHTHMLRLAPVQRQQNNTPVSLSNILAR